jgi:hypothetical protein
MAEKRLSIHHFPIGLDLEAPWAKTLVILKHFEDV